MLLIILIYGDLLSYIGWTIYFMKFFHVNLLLSAPGFVSPVIKKAYY